MIELRYESAGAERLFQYCFARTIAERWGFCLRGVPISAFPNTRTQIDGEIFISPIHYWVGDMPYDRTVQRTLNASNLQVAPTYRVVLEGAFRSPSLFADRAEDIRREWLAVRDSPALRSAGDFAICVNDTGRDSKELAEAEIRQLAEAIPHSRLHLFTSKPLARLMHRLARDLGAEIELVEGWRSLLAIRSFQKIAFCQSSLFWWAAFLSEAREIYLPPVDRGVQAASAVSAMCSRSVFAAVRPDSCVVSLWEGSSGLAKL